LIPIGLHRISPWRSLPPETEEALAREAERPVKTADRRATVQVAAMMTVLDQLLLLYPQRAAVPMVSKRPSRSILDREW
jgi:hypothetical protein